LDAHDIVYSSHIILQQAHPQAVDGEDGLQIWVCENTEQQSQTTNKWWSVGSSKELTTANYTQSVGYKMSHSILGLQGFFGMTKATYKTTMGRHQLDSSGSE